MEQKCHFRSETCQPPLKLHPNYVNYILPLRTQLIRNRFSENIIRRIKPEILVQRQWSLFFNCINPQCDGNMHYRHTGNCPLNNDHCLSDFFGNFLIFLIANNENVHTSKLEAFGIYTLL